MSKLKTLNESRGAKLKELDAIRNAAKDRAFTDEERSKFDGLATEIETINGDVQREMRAESENFRKAPDLSKGDERSVERFSMKNLLNHMDRVSRGQHSVLDGAEAEFIAEGQKEAREAGIQLKGIGLPQVLLRRAELRDMGVTTGTTAQYGGELVATDKSGLLDDFYKKSVMISGGATVLNGLVGNLSLPRYVKATNPAGKAENAAADELSPTVTEVTLTPKRLPAVIDISDQLLLQSNVALMTFLQRALRKQLSSVQEIAFWHGSGTAEAKGVAGVSGIGSVVGGTNGAAPDWADIIDLETAVAIDDADVGSLHYVTNAAIRGKLKKTLVTATYGDRMVWSGNDLNGYMPLVTNAVKSTLTKGGSSACSAIFFGNLSDYVVGCWGGLNLEIIRDKTLTTQGQRALVANLYYDGNVLRAESFAAMLDALAA
jgi:HK97 family phage major capsid protein